MDPPSFQEPNVGRFLKSSSQKVSGKTPNRHLAIRAALGAALTDTPISTAPSSPKINALHPKSSAARLKATTLDIPGLTRSKISPDGKIAESDVGSKLVIVMVGLPARGKSYITKKLSRYLNWLQHDTKIFNVGERRREAVSSVGGPRTQTPKENPELEDNVLVLDSSHLELSPGMNSERNALDNPGIAARILIEGPPALNISGYSDEMHKPTIKSDDSQIQQVDESHKRHSSNEPEPAGKGHRDTEILNQSASFFDPANKEASLIREQVALSTLDELLDYVLNQGGSVGIFDATNSTLERRKTIIKHIRDRAGPELGVLFIESLCLDQTILESNMRLKLSGPDYKDKDPETALADFKKRVEIYEKHYVPIGDYEEAQNMAYVKMIDVGKKIISHQIKGFLSSQAVYYLLNFNLAPRQIWITRHGESEDNIRGRIGGNSQLSPYGDRFAKALATFITKQREDWEVRQQKKALSMHFPPRPGDSSPPNPDYVQDKSPKNFCVWTSMLKRSIQTGQYFDEEDFDVKQMKMLDDLNAGQMDGMTYEEIKRTFPHDYDMRKADKLHYRYPGPGGEGYLDVVNRLRAVIVEVERMTDHVLLVGHRSIVRVLLSYFLGLHHNDIVDLDVPLGVLYMLEPKPYGVEFKTYRYNPADEGFVNDDNFKLPFHVN